MGFTSQERTQYLYAQALTITSLADAEIAKVMYWCKDPQIEPIPDIFLAISFWTKAEDLLEQLKKLPERMLEKIEQSAQTTEAMTIQEILTQLAEMDGFLTSSEAHQSALFQSTLNQQLTDAVTDWQKQVSLLDVADDEELAEALDTRDMLEYARMGINIIRLEYPRLKDVEYDLFANALKTSDETLKQSLGEKTIQLPYADHSFWWRQEQEEKKQNGKRPAQKKN